MTEKEKAYIVGYGDGYEKGYRDATTELLDKIKPGVEKVRFLRQKLESFNQENKDYEGNNN